MRIWANITPTIVIPEIAFAPDIKGVCSVGGTFVISSNPRNIERANIVIAAISAASSIISPSIISIPPSV